MKISNFWKSSASFSLLTLVSRVFGYVRDLIFTNYLGAGSIHDIFVVIFKIPNVFRSFFGEGALSQSLTPSIIEARTKTNKFLNQVSVSYTHLRAHETGRNLLWPLVL